MKSDGNGRNGRSHTHFYVREHGADSRTQADKREKNNAQKRTEGWKQKGIWLFWYAVVPVFAFYLMECYEHNPFAEVRVGAQLFNIFV